MKKEEWITQILEKYEQTNFPNPTEVTHIHDFLNSNPDFKLSSRVSYESVLNASNEWVVKLNQKFANQKSSGTVELISRLNESLMLVRLVDDMARGWEGKQMGHCVGGASYSNHAGLYSIRDKNNEPHCTIEISEGKLIQIRGKANKVISSKYTNSAVEALSYLGVDFRSKLSSLGYYRPSPTELEFLKTYFDNCVFLEHDNREILYCGNIIKPNREFPRNGFYDNLFSLFCIKGNCPEGIKEFIKSSVLPEHNNWLAFRAACFHNHTDLLKWIVSNHEVPKEFVLAAIQKSFKIKQPKVAHFLMRSIFLDESEWYKVFRSHHSSVAANVPLMYHKISTTLMKSIIMNDALAFEQAIHKENYNLLEIFQYALSVKLEAISKKCLEIQAKRKESSSHFLTTPGLIKDKKICKLALTFFGETDETNQSLLKGAIQCGASDFALELLSKNMKFNTTDKLLLLAVKNNLLEVTQALLSREYEATTQELNEAFRHACRSNKYLPVLKILPWDKFPKEIQTEEFLNATRLARREVFSYFLEQGFEIEHNKQLVVALKECRDSDIVNLIRKQKLKTFFAYWFA